MGSCLPTRLQEDHFDLLNFIFECRRHDWEKVENYAYFIDVNHKLKSISDRPSINGGHCLLANFLRNTDGKQAEILESLLFPQPFQGKPRRPCDIFDQQFEPDYAKSKDECLTYPSPFPFLFTTRLEYETSRSIPRDRSLAPYVKLLLEAAGILPSPQNRNDPSFWRNHGGKWRNDKDLFVWNEIVVHLLDHHHRDSGIFELLLENDLIKSDRRLGELFSVLATKKHSGITLQNILSSGKFPKCLRNENISPEVLGITTAAPLYTAVVTGNAEYVKELVVNKVGGDLRSGGLVNDRRTYLSKDPLLDENPILSLEALKGVDSVWRRGFGFTSVNLLHFAAGSTAASSSSSSGPFDEILTLLITMPGSGEFKNAVAPFIIQTRRSDFSKDEIPVTPAMLALIQGHESRVKILIANGGDQLPPRLHSKFSSLEQWFEDFKASDAGARLRIVKQMYS